MNKSAVALAADSAVTVQNHLGAKVYNTVNKLFSLSNHAPVGVMVYGGAELCGVPWETLIKEYRKDLAAQKYDTLEEYSEDLMDYISRCGYIAADIEREEILRFSTVLFTNYIVSDIRREVHLHFLTDSNITRAQVISIITSTLDSKVEELEQIPFVNGFDRRSVSSIIRTYRSELDETAQLAFEELPLGETNRSKVRRIIALWSTKQIPSPEQSGVVVAGFGERDLYPRLVSHEVDGFILGRPKRFASETLAVTPSNSAVVKPFAQQEMVYLFMEGVDPDHRATIEGALAGVIEQLPTAVADAVGLKGRARTSLVRNLRKVGVDLMSEFGDTLETYRSSKHVYPIIEAVAALPKDELGAMAESLVNLTSFKRRVTLDTETVGGEIDVAVVSKGDGLIWLKRKHYFDSDRNPQFMARYRA